MKQKTEIEFELNETVAYSRRGERSKAYCPQCETLVEMVSPYIGAVLAHSTEREVYRLVETDQVHFMENDGVLICRKSLDALKGKISY